MCVVVNLDRCLVYAALISEPALGSSGEATLLADSTRR